MEIGKRFSLFLLLAARLREHMPMQDSSAVTLEQLSAQRQALPICIYKASWSAGPQP